LTCFALGEDEKLIASGSERGNIRIWNVETGARAHSIKGVLKSKIKILCTYQ